MDDQTQVLSLRVSELEASYETLFLENCTLKSRNKQVETWLDNSLNELEETTEQLRATQRTLEILLERMLFNEGTFYTIEGVCSQVHGYNRRSLAVLQGCLLRMVSSGILAKTWNHTANAEMYCRKECLEPDFDMDDL